MKGYLLSLKRQYVKHYGERKARYVATLLATFALPLIVAALVCDSAVAVSTSSVVDISYNYVDPRMRLRR